MNLPELQEKRKENYYKFKTYTRSLVAGYHIVIYNDNEFIVTIRNMQFTEYDTNLLINLFTFLRENKIAYGIQRLSAKTVCNVYFIVKFKMFLNVLGTFFLFLFLVLKFIYIC